MAVSPGDVVLARLRDVDGDTKVRPALVVCVLPGDFQSVLLCGITTRQDRLIEMWDEQFDAGDIDFSASGLLQPSSLRLSFIQSVPGGILQGRIGEVSEDRLQRIRSRLGRLIEGTL